MLYPGVTMPPPPADTKKLIAMGALVLVGLFLRLGGAAGDLWLDEVWSYYMARDMGSAWDAVTGHIQVEHHPLNTLFFFLLGEQSELLWYRALSLAAGLGTLILLACEGQRRGVAGIALLLGSLSYPLVFYASEARGYAPVIFFSLATFSLLQSHLQRRRWSTRAGFWGTVVLGFLSHLTFAYVYLSALVWSCWAEVRSPRSRRELTAELLSVHLVPALFIVGYYFIHVRHLKQGLGPEQSLATTLVQTFGIAATAVTTDPWVIPSALAGLAVVSAALYLSREEPRGTLVFHLCLGLFSLCLILVSGRANLHLRYFSACLPFFYLLVATLCGAILKRGGAARSLCIVGLLLFAGLHFWRDLDLIKTGRGDYAGAVRHMAAGADSRTILVASDHDFRNRMLLTFYSRVLPPGYALRYVRQGQWPAAGTEWFVWHRYPGQAAPDSEFNLWGISYALSRVSRSVQLAGFDWYLYRRQ